MTTGAQASSEGAARAVARAWRQVAGRGLLGPLTLLAGIVIAWADTRPNWDDAGVTAGALFLVAGLASAGGVRPWVAAAVVVLPLLIAEVRSPSPMLLVPPAVALAGAYGGRLWYRVVAARRSRGRQSHPQPNTGGDMKRSASAVWRGGLKEGKGTISTGSGVLTEAQYSFGTRFENGVGTNPEELIGAAHAGCFSMALSAQLGNAGLAAESIRTRATVTLEKTDAGFTITAVHLDVAARVPGADRAAFETAALAAKAGCPVSRVLNAAITMDARLEA